METIIIQQPLIFNIRVTINSTHTVKLTTLNTLHLQSNKTLFYISIVKTCIYLQLIYYNILIYNIFPLISTNHSIAFSNRNRLQIFNTQCQLTTNTSVPTFPGWILFTPEKIFFYFHYVLPPTFYFFLILILYLLHYYFTY